MIYHINQKFFSIGDKYYITDEAGNNLYFVKSSIFNPAKTVRIYDMQDNLMIFIKKRLFRVMTRFDVRTPDKKTIGMVRRKFTFFKKNCIMKLHDVEYHIDGSIIAHNFEIIKGDDVVATVGKKLLSFHDKYVLEVAEAEEQLPMLATVIALDCILHDNSSKRHR